MRRFAMIMLGAIMLGFGTQAAAATDTTQAPCSSPEAAQFDFWVGDWQLSWGDTLGGSNHITKPLGDCVIQEQFSGNGPAPFKGMSFSVYDPVAHQWQQTWVDNSGGYMVFTGGFADGKMTLSRKTTTKDGTPVIQRMVFSEITPNSLTWDWQGSRDNGVTWKTNWHILYRRTGK